MSENEAPALVATCWTSAGTAAPLDNELSPIPILERVRAAAATGWAGLGFGQDDLREARDTIGFEAVRAAIDEAGLTHVEVELLSDWWLPDGSWRPTWELLVEAATALGAAFIKLGPGMGEPLPEVAPFVEPLRALADEARAAGIRLALEPFPFGLIATIPQGAELVRAVDRTNVGLVVDSWHVFRPGTSFAELRDCLDRDLIFGVELSDTDAEVRGTLFEDTRDNRRYVGDGVQDVAGFVRTMRELGFDGPWGVEVLSNEHRARDLADGLRHARATALTAF
ncbi:sugar phosphate isomerase/epimerase family protein [Gulosibacter faecalis]|uniref:Sugar phosphate isomerase/epimerase family protein n=1 Tax=Gulosibacter faecalis TaxID=272240 RepID=A0ABW5UX52_9MICO|nr:sugar phosphate isomerase/epimerase family protein [Gulosibacter faecalis]